MRSGGVQDAPISAEEWHGWGWTDNRHPDLHIGRLPGRKQYVLWLEDHSAGNCHIRPLAYFRTREDAYAAMAAIDLLTGHRKAARHVQEARG